MGPYFKRGMLIAGLVLLVDQLSKFWILNGLKLPELGSVKLLPFLNFTMVWNYGISMGLPIGDSLGKWGIIALTSAISIWLVSWLYKCKNVMEAWAVAMILGGAIGNIIDRFLYGAVVDFIHLHAWGKSFYVFNVADSGVSIGALLLIVSLRPSEKGPKKA